MDRLLGIDYGDVRVGLAISDPLKITAAPLVLLKNNKELIASVIKILSEYNFSRIIIGMPKNMDGSQGFSAEKVLKFKDLLSKQIDIDIELIDERLTTVEASRKLQEAGINTRKQKDKIDMMAAVLILQTYLDKV